MNPLPQPRVPNLRQGLIVANKLRIERSETAPAHFDGAVLSNFKVEVGP
jgi:hypothetical protein